MRRGLILLTLACAVSSLPIHALAATCAADGVIQERLARGFGEALERQGPARAGHRLELWSNPVLGTWTMLVITPDGLACLAASGRSKDDADLQAYTADV